MTDELETPALTRLCMDFGSVGDRRRAAEAKPPEECSAFTGLSRREAKSGAIPTNSACYSTTPSPTEASLSPRNWQRAAQGVPVLRGEWRSARSRCPAAAFVRAGRKECRRAADRNVGECGRVVPEKHDRRIFTSTPWSGTFRRRTAVPQVEWIHVVPARSLHGKALLPRQEEASAARPPGGRGDGVRLSASGTPEPRALPPAIGCLRRGPACYMSAAQSRINPLCAPTTDRPCGPRGSARMRPARSPWQPAK